MTRSSKIAASLLLSLILIQFSPVRAEVITMHDPVMVDSSATRFPAERIGPLTYCNEGVVCQGEHCNLVAVRTQFTTLLEESSSWSLFRTNLLGDLLDTVPVPLLPGISTASNQAFDLYDIVWSDPYFYVIGWYVDHNGDYADSLSYYRVTSDLQIIDPEPHCFLPKGYKYRLDFFADDSSIWMVNTIDDPAVSIYDIEADSVTVEEVVPTAGPAKSYAFCKQSGLYMASLTTEHPDTLFNTMVDESGVVTELGYASLSASPENHLLNSTSIVPYRNDSLAVCFFDVLATGDPVMSYYFVSPSDGISHRKIRTVSVPYLPGSRLTTEASFFMQDNHMVALSTVGSSEEENIAYYRFDLDVAALRQVLRLPDWHTVADWGTYGILKSGSLVQRYFLEGDAVRCFRLDLEDPLRTSGVSTIQYRSQQQRFPTLIVDNQGPLLYFQQTDSVSPKLRAFRIGSPPAFEPTPLGGILDDGNNPYRPYLATVGSKKALIWHEPLTGCNPANWSSECSKVQQRLVLFEGDLPTSSDLANQNAIYDIAFSQLLPGAHYYPPDFVLVDSTVYFSIIQSYFTMFSWDSEVRYGLRSLDYVTGLLTDYSSSFQTNGRSPLLPYGDSLLSIRSWISCAEHNNIECLSYNFGYNIAVIHDGEVVRAYGPSYSLSRAGTYYGYYLPGDVFQESSDGQTILSLSASGDVVACGDSYETFQSLASVDNYADDYVYQYGNMYQSRAVPIATSTANLIVVLSTVSNLSQIMAFDRDWQFMGSSPLEFEGIPIEVSEFVYDETTNHVVFAYSSFVPDYYAAPRVFVQSFSIDAPTPVGDEPVGLPISFSLNPNYPNPFNPSTVIEYSVPTRGQVELSVFNILGRRVSTLISEEKPPGSYQVSWDGTDADGNTVASGVYFYRLTCGEQTASRKMLLLK